MLLKFLQFQIVLSIKNRKIRTLFVNNVRRAFK